MQAETIIDIVNDAGGWCGVAKMAAEFRKFFPREWEIFRTHVEWIDDLGTRKTNSDEKTTLGKIAEQFGISTDTLINLRYRVPQKIAYSTIRTDRVLM